MSTDEALHAGDQSNELAAAKAGEAVGQQAAGVLGSGHDGSLGTASHLPKTGVAAATPYLWNGCSISSNALVIPRCPPI
jgi:hypothetical protein